MSKMPIENIEKKVVIIGVLAALLTLLILTIPGDLKTGSFGALVNNFIVISYWFAFILLVCVYFAAYYMKSNISKEDQEKVSKIFNFLYDNSIFLYGAISVPLLVFGVGPKISEVISGQFLGILVIILLFGIAYYIVKREWRYAKKKEEKNKWFVFTNNIYNNFFRVIGILLILVNLYFTQVNFRFLSFRY